MIIIIVGFSVVIIVVAITSRSELNKKRICIIIFRPLINSKIINFWGRWLVPMMIMMSLVLLGVLTLLTVGVTLNI